MNALTAFASLGLYTLFYPERQKLPRALLLDALEVLLAECCLASTYADKPNAAVASAARMTAMWLADQMPTLSNTARLFELLLDALTGDGEALSAKLSQLDPRTRALAQQQLKTGARPQQAPNAFPPIRTFAAMLKDKVVSWHAFLRQAIQSDDPERNLEAMIEALGTLDLEALLAMMMDRPWRDLRVLSEASARVAAALSRAAPRLDPQKLAVIRCLFAGNGAYECATPADWAIALGACDDVQSTQSRHAALAAIGFNSTLLLDRKAMQTALERGELGAKDALRLLQVALPFWGRSRDNAIALIRETFKGMDASVQDEVELCIRLWQDAIPEEQLVALAERKDPVGAMAAARLIALLPERAKEHKLRYPYYLIADFTARTSLDPMTVFKALTEDLSVYAIDESKGLLDLIATHSWYRLLDEEDWSDLNPAQRGVLLGILLWNSGQMMPHQGRSAVDKCLEGLSAPEIEVAAEYSCAVLRKGYSENISNSSYNAAYERFTDLANAHGSEARLLALTINPLGGKDPRGVITRFIASPAITYSRKAKKKVALTAERMNTPEDARRIARMLTRCFPAPSKVNCDVIATVSSKLTGDALRAFLDALSPQWQLAVAIATSGRALKQTGKRYLRAFVSRFAPHEQALLLTIKPIRDTLGGANAPRPLNKAEFQAQAQALVGLVPDTIERAVPSLEAQALADALLGRSARTEVPPPILDYAQSLQRGHYPTSIPSLVLRPATLPCPDRRNALAR